MYIRFIMVCVCPRLTAGVKLEQTSENCALESKYNFLLQVS